jgi:hypothetical protein
MHSIADMQRVEEVHKIRVNAESAYAIISFYFCPHHEASRVYASSFLALCWSFSRSAVCLSVAF